MRSAGSTSVYVSAQLTPAEKEQLDAAVEAAKRDDPTMNRNRFIRDWISTLRSS